MNIIPLEFSIVVVGQDCNPTILNPDFLKYREIVPEGWGWSLAGAAITTPAFAVVPYDSGVTVKVETGRFQVTDQRTSENVDQSKAIAIARSYVKVLPHVRYTGVGINFRRLVEMNEPDAFLKRQFLKPGPWDQVQFPLLGVNIKFVYPHENGQLNLSLEGSVVLRQQGQEATQTPGVLSHANYHRDCNDYPSDLIVLQHIEQAENDEKHFGVLLNELLRESLN
jgi:hypothetical protein